MSLALVCALLTTVTVQADNGGVIVAPIKKSERPSTDPRYKGQVMREQASSISTGAVKYALRYLCKIDPAQPQEVGWSEGYVGMPGPSSCNWYHGGFLFVRLNGQEIGKAPLKSMTVMEQGRRGILDLLWDGAEAELKLRFLGEPDSRALFTEISWRPKRKIKSVQVMARCYPSFFTSYMKKKGLRTMTTPGHEAKEKNGGYREPLEPKRDWWILFSDGVFDGSEGKGVGPCALLFLPEQVQSGSVGITNYPMDVTLNFEPKLTNIRLIFWDFNGLTNDQALAYMKEHAAQAQAHLRDLDFRTTAARSFDPAKAQAEVATLFGDTKGGQALREKVERKLQQMASVRQKVTAAGAKGWVDPEAEIQLAKLQAELEELKWDIKFFALFND